MKILGLCVGAMDWISEVEGLEETSIVRGYWSCGGV